jgi:hypothetical protein
MDGTSVLVFLAIGARGEMCTFVKMCKLAQYKNVRTFNLNI